MADFGGSMIPLVRDRYGYLDWDDGTAKGRQCLLEGHIYGAWWDDERQVMNGQRYRVHWCDRCGDRDQETLYDAT